MARNLMRLRYVSFESQLSNDNIIGDQIRLSSGQFWKDGCSRKHCAGGDVNGVGAANVYAHGNSYVLS